MPITSIDDPNLPSEFNIILKSLKIIKPTNVQMQSWPAILYGNDVLVISPTGTGKTLAYTLPIIIHILSRLNCYELNNNNNNNSNIDNNNIKKRKYPVMTSSSSSSSLISNTLSPMALILLPTRELAIQVYSILKSFKYFFKITSGIVYGGHDKMQQIEKLRSSCYINNDCSSNSSGILHILVATPGRLIDFIQTNNNNNDNNDDDEQSKMIIDINNVSYVVIDEADRMLNLGFIEQIEKIFNYLPLQEKRQSLLFSATFLGKLNHIIEKYIKNPVIIRCNAMEFHDHSRVKDSDEALLENNYNNNNIKDVISDRVVIVADKSCINDNDVNVNLNNMKDIDNINNNDNKDDVEENIEKKTVHFDNNNINKTSSLTISPTILQKIHVCANHKKPRLLIKYILQCRNNEKINKIRQVGNMLIFANKIKTLKFLFDFLGEFFFNM